jgi:hypothetical protein
VRQRRNGATGAVGLPSTRMTAMTLTFLLIGAIEQSLLGQDVPLTTSARRVDDPTGTVAVPEILSGCRGELSG